MKKGLVFILLLAFIGTAFIATNPNKSDFKDYLEEHYLADLESTQVRKSSNTLTDDLVEGINEIIHNIRPIQGLDIKREDYFLFSVYTVSIKDLGEERQLKYIGYFKKFSIQK